MHPIMNSTSFVANKMIERRLIDVSTKVGGIALALATTKTVSPFKQDNNMSHIRRSKSLNFGLDSYKSKHCNSKRIYKRASTSKEESSFEMKKDTVPSSLQGGMIHQKKYSAETHTPPLCQILFDADGDNLYIEHLLQTGKQNVMVGEWKCDGDANVCTRDLSYDHVLDFKPKHVNDHDVSKTGIHRVFETQTLYSPADGVCVVDAVVSGPDMPFGKVFSTKMRYVMMVDHEESKSIEHQMNKQGKVTNLEISHEVMWTQRRPIYALPLKRAVRKEILRSFENTDKLLETYATGKKKKTRRQTMSPIYA